MEELKGNIKQGIGKVTGNEELEAEGKVEHDTAKASREMKGRQSDQGQRRRGRRQGNWRRRDPSPRRRRSPEGRHAAGRL